MEPNQNMTGEGDLNTAPVAQQNNAGAPEPEQSIAPVTEQKDLPEPDNLPEQNVVPTSNDDLSKHDTTEKKKGGNGMLIGMILAIILAVGGIGFGVWAMMDGNNQKAQLNQQIDTLKQQKSALEKQVEELTEKVAGYEYDVSGYEIFPPEWGEAEASIEDGLFTIRNASGEVYTQLEEYTIEEIVSCDSGTEEAPLPMTCVVKTEDGEAKIIYNFDEQSLEYVDLTE